MIVHSIVIEQVLISHITRSEIAQRYLSIGSTLSYTGTGLKDRDETTNLLKATIFTS